MSTTPFNPPAGTVPMFDPTGTLRDVPQAQMMEARQNGMEIGVRMQAPDNTVRVVPASKYQEAFQNGMKPLPIEQQAVKNPGFLSNLWSDVKGYVSGIGSQMPNFSGSPLQYSPGLNTSAAEQGSLQEQQQFGAAQRQRAQQGYSPFYQAAALPASLVMNVPGAEQSAQQGDVGGVLGHAAAPVAVGAATLGVTRGLPALADRLPSFENAAETFKGVSAAAGKVPVDLSAPGDTALRLAELRDTGNYMPRVVTKFLQEATDPNRPPMAFDRVRDFAQTASRLSVNENNNMTPNVQRLVGQLAHQLNDAAGQAAGSVGQQQQFEAAMQEWRQAAQLRGIGQSVKQNVLPPILKGALQATGAAGVGYPIYRAVKNFYEK